jgi:hypothetical protein
LLFLYAARGFGRFALRRLGLAAVDPLLGLMFSLAIGLGILAYGVLALGLVGWLTPPAVFAWVALGSALAWRESIRHGREWGDPYGPFRVLALGLKVGLWVAVAIFALSLIQALTPVWDYDGLMYHLQGPALFLKAGRLQILPDLWQANGPFTTEMLFLVGLAAGSDVVSKILHLGRRDLALVHIRRCPASSEQSRRVAGRYLLGVPCFGLAYVDLAWATSFLCRVPGMAGVAPDGMACRLGRNGGVGDGLEVLSACVSADPARGRRI